MGKMKIAIIKGSLRKESYSGAVAEILKEKLKDEFEITVPDLSKLAMYNQDLDDSGNLPKEWEDFRIEIREADAYLFVTPEYNRSMPPLLKNALDIASRPYGQNSWAGKPGATVSVSVGAPGGFGSNHHLRQCAVFLDIFMMQQPEAYLGNIATSLKDGQPDERLDRFLTKFAQEAGEWFARFNLT